MSTTRRITIAGSRFEVLPWLADAAVAYLSCKGPQQLVDPSALARCLNEVRALGYSAAITPALHPEETQPYFANGFVEFDDLVVLGHDLADYRSNRSAPRVLHTPRSGTVPADAPWLIRRARHREFEDVLRLDARAFSANWRIDRRGLDEARAATVHSRLRVAESDGELVGYAVVGRSRSMAFLQRLATEPRRAGEGVGTSLVVDSLSWAARRGCSRVLVNTQQTNRRALALYENLGFARTPTRLVVLRCSL